MNVKSAWLNLPVVNLEASEDFYQQIGFEIKKSDDMMDKMRGIATLDNTVIMLIETKQFKKVSRLSKIGNNEALISLSLNTKAEVDQLLDLVESANGTVIERGTMHEGFYGGLFSDIDGHLFNIITM
ncbi:glyoxalase [Staphylococcus gallinarum]|uniref:VOC family protein n=1 Tax=Staphylococcus gallinarum TaxID=1293 RepID=UPI000D1C3185|nr:VOC family protein [Staphylococcus gallinarum]MBU7217273.1 glyoxalase [Staphylococcus gallinarum]MCD8792423.1 glyoxalase [Staphylococcus gallinarum]MCD8829418.1 glyoxalase [Staphylococcus gallinarum]MDN6413130.1 glyoxalase [Staphylococcus gallinarum]MEB6056343.1 glyoxalase [Staphylococcus gallinarum]